MFTNNIHICHYLYVCRCNLRWFRGCITSTEAVEDLITLGKSDEGPYLIVSLRQPLEHPLMKLQGTQHNLCRWLAMCSNIITDIMIYSSYIIYI